MNYFKILYKKLKYKFYIFIIRIWVKKIENNNKDKYILFCVGSISDMMMIASLTSAFCNKYSDTIIICNKFQSDIFRVYCNNNNKIKLKYK